MEMPIGVIIMEMPMETEIKEMITEVQTEILMMETIMEMLETEDVKTFKKLGINMTVIGVVAAALIVISVYFS